MRDRLPLGSAIRLENKSSIYVIVGTNISINEKRYDYLCVTYPYGWINEEKPLYINDDEVKAIVHLGDIND